MADARKIAITALCRVEKDGAYSNILLNDALNKQETSERDKALATMLFYGVLDRKITIDYWLNSLSKIKVKKMDPITRQALRIGIYQLAYMDKVPSSAAVNESVNIVKKSKERRNAGFVNAVLRKAASALPELPNADTTEGISVICSCPEDIVKELADDYGKCAAFGILKSFLEPSDLFVKVNSVLISDDDFANKLESENITFEKIEGKSAFKLLQAVDLFNSNLYRDGLFHVQDLASQDCAEAVGALPKQRVLDVCAAPGGKSFSIAEHMNNCGEVISCDCYEKRVELIKQGALRLKLDCINPICNDATIYNEGLGEFDCVLCDVPCSGWGVMRRKPEIKYKEIKSFDELEKIQKTILQVSSRYVKNGGRLVYSTCTLRKKENEAVVNEFLSKNSDFKLLFDKTVFPDSGSDGFYHAVMIKK